MPTYECTNTNTQGALERASLAAFHIYEIYVWAYCFFFFLIYSYFFISILIKCSIRNLKLTPRQCDDPRRATEWPRSVHGSGVKLFLGHGQHGDNGRQVHLWWRQCSHGRPLQLKTGAGQELPPNLCFRSSFGSAEGGRKSGKIEPLVENGFR